ncbi:MAG: hypothetical protein U1E21_00760 [Reyranellaceae bacterium]
MPKHLKQKPCQWHSLTTEANVTEIHRQLYQGVRPGVLARQVQATDPPLFSDRTAEQVRHWFADYHRKVIQPEWTRGVLSAAHFSRRDRLIKRLDVIAELETLTVKLGARFDRFFGHESWPTGPGNAGKNAPPPRPLPGLDVVAKNYRTTLVELARLYLETGLLYRVPTKIESALTTAMGGRSVFEFTQEEVDRFNRATLLEGTTPEAIEQAEREEAGDNGPAGGDLGGGDLGGKGPRGEGPGGGDGRGGRGA